ncbi:hypothetical protein V5799_020815 [Amblyomma americanum]|uniref:Methyltransferase type 11 domain-containing protein n=1 Tax=Amblyomma americanum TaxID=6943 RepID=A0AAQ4ET84_AMBAM
MLKLAAEKYSHPKIQYLKLSILGDVDEFVRREGQFQRLYSFLMLQWIRDQRLAMENIEKLLVPGGECLLLFERNLHFFDLFEEMIKSSQWSKYSHVSSYHTGPYFA